MTDTDTDTDAAPVAEADGPAPVAARRHRLLLALVGLLFAACVGLGVLAAVQTASLAGERDDRRAIAAATGAIAEALLTYDHTDMDATRRRVLDLASGGFKDEYDAAFPELTQLMEETKATSSKASISDVFVGDISDGSATAVAVADVTATGAAGPRRLLDQYIRVSLVKVEGRWRIDKVVSLNLGSGGAHTPTRSGRSDRDHHHDRGAVTQVARAAV